MSVCTVSSKGQITLPTEARRRLGIHPHDRVHIEVSGKRIVVTPTPDFMSLENFLGEALSPEKEKQAMHKLLKARSGKKY